MKKTIIAVIITAVICISGTAFAIIKIDSKDVTYNDTTVKDKLDELYTTQTNVVNTQTTQITNLESQVTNLQNQVTNPNVNYLTKSYSPSYVTSEGTRTMGRTASKTVSAGQYMVISTAEITGWETNTSINNESSLSSISYTSGACSEVNKNFRRSCNTSGTRYCTNISVHVHVCNFSAQTTVTATGPSWNNDTSNTSSVGLTVLKLS